MHMYIYEEIAAMLQWACRKVDFCMREYVVLSYISWSHDKLNKRTSIHAHSDTYPTNCNEHSRHVNCARRILPHLSIIYRKATGSRRKSGIAVTIPTPKNFFTTDDVSHSRR